MFCFLAVNKNRVDQCNPENLEEVSTYFLEHCFSKNFVLRQGALVEKLKIRAVL